MPKIPFILTSVLLLLSCSPEQGNPAPKKDSSDEWVKTSPREAGLDSHMIQEMLADIERRRLNLHSLLILYRDQLVLEAYFFPYTAEDLHILFSSTKSVLSCLVGIAFDKGYIPSVNESLSRYFPDAPEDKRDITIHQLLTMTSGMDWNAAVTTEEMLQSTNWTDFVLSRPMKKPPYRFNYNNGAAHLLSALVEKATGLELDQFAQETLFTPLSITDASWTKSPEGTVSGFSHLYLKPRDMLKIGALLLHNGEWRGQSLISSNWIVQASREYHKDNILHNGYGYLWRMNRFGGYRSQGFAGQYLFIQPEQEMAVLFTAGLSDADYYVPIELVEKYLSRVTNPAPPIHNDADQYIRDFVQRVAHPSPARTGLNTNRMLTLSVESNPQNLASFTLSTGESYGQIVLCYAHETNTITFGMDGSYRESIVSNITVMNRKPRTLKAFGYWVTEALFQAEVYDLAEATVFSYQLNLKGSRFTLSIKPDIYYYRLQYRGTIDE